MEPTPSQQKPVPAPPVMDVVPPQPQAAPAAAPVAETPTDSTQPASAKNTVSKAQPVSGDKTSLAIIATVVIVIVLAILAVLAFVNTAK